MDKRNGRSGSQEPLFGVDSQTIALPLHRWALDRQSFRRGLKKHRRVSTSPLGAPPPSPTRGRRPERRRASSLGQFKGSLRNFEPA